MKKVTFNHRVGQVVLALYRRPYIATTYVIAREIGISQSYVSRIVKHMYDAGMIDYRYIEHRKNVQKRGYYLSEQWTIKMDSNTGYLQLFAALQREALNVRTENEATSWL